MRGGVNYVRRYRFANRSDGAV